ncbi:MAG: Fic family protein [Bacteroidia bacterium]|nr:Fic family protein [Bacteroidia bacterium]
MKPYIYQRAKWPDFTWDHEALHLVLGKVRNLQGRLTGKMEGLGFALRNDALLDTLTLDVLKSTEIEGEQLNPDQVRSSIARRLGMDISGLIPSDRNVDGMVEMMLNATQHYNEPLSAKRLYGWQSSLFPSGWSGMYQILTGKWRDDSTGPMQVVSGAMGKEKIHYRAPDATVLKTEMKTFLNWFNKEETLDPVVKAGVAHLWFITLHPFEDGNGRIARALTDLLLARADESQQRFYSMSAQIRVERKGYYEILEKIQTGSIDITRWLQWFLNCLMHALQATDQTLSKVLYKADFWKKHTNTPLNDRQKLLINKLLNRFDGKLTSSKWAKIAKCSADTALRDIQGLIDEKILCKEQSGGRSTNYAMVV